MTNQLFATVRTGKNGRGVEIHLSGKKEIGALPAGKEFFDKMINFPVPTMLKNGTFNNERQLEIMLNVEKRGKAVSLGISALKDGMFFVEFEKGSGIPSLVMTPAVLARLIEFREFVFLNARAQPLGYKITPDSDGKRYLVFEGKNAIFPLRYADLEKFLQRVENAAEERKKAGIE